MTKRSAEVSPSHPELIGRTLVTLNRVSLSRGDEQILNNIDLNIVGGEKVAIVGPNGVGKTTLLKIIIGEESPDGGNCQFAKGCRIAYVPQHTGKLSENTSMTVQDLFLSARGLDTVANEMHAIETEMATGDISSRRSARYSELQEEFTRMDGWNAQNLIAQILQEMGFSTKDLNRSASSFGSGQKEKLFLAKAVFTQPDLIIMDEPTNHLDGRTINWLRTFLTNFSGAALIVSHNQSFLSGFIDKVVEIDQETRESREYRGDFSRYTSLVAVERKTQEQADKKHNRRRLSLLDDIARLGAGNRAGVAHAREKSLERLDEESRPHQEGAKGMKKLEFEVGQSGSRDVLMAEDVRKRQGLRMLDFSDVKIEIKRGQKVLIAGSEGTGKSTLLNILAGREESDNGTVVLGSNIDIGYFDQEHSDLSQNGTVLEEIQRGTGVSESKARGVLGHFLFSRETVFKRVSYLSEGEKARLLLAKLAVGKHNLLILDEPTNHLDSNTRDVLAEALKNYRGTLILATQDSELINKIRFNQTINLPENTGRMRLF